MFSFFKKKESFLQHFFTVVFSAFAVVLFWRGSWGLADTYLFPEEPTLSYLVSIFMALVILYLNDKRLNELSHR